jgi:CopG family transcriptional regulator, nickel-responsive regulator
MSVTSISLTSRLRHKLDEIKEEKGYSSRSEVVRDAIRTYLSDYEISRIESTGNLTATITAIYQKNCPHLDETLLQIRHEYDDILEGNLHIHVGELAAQKSL